MTDALNATGAFAPAETLISSIALETVAAAATSESPDVDADLDGAPAEPEMPNGFVTLGLAPELVHAVKDLGYTQPTTVQLKTIPLALPSDGLKADQFVDLMVSSQTGSGKTAAFLLPVLHTLLKQQAQAEMDERAEFDRLVAEAAEKGEPAPKKPKRKDPTNHRNFKAPTPGALIVCPTRELAQQVANDAIDLVRHCRGLRIANIVGGMPYQLQIAKLQNANLVVATPGRLLDLQRSMQIKLDEVQFLVVDEADRMLDLGFSDDLAEINQLTIQRKQTMMFSATFAPRIQQLAARVMREPQRITIDSPQEKHANIKQVLFWADNAHHKRKLLDHWLRDTTINQAIVFASTQIECDGLANDLQQAGFDAVALHGALSQGLRNRRLMALRNGQVQFLVATDVAARGIDVPTITHVFNFGLPMKAEDYTHRIGRTGRAGRDGIAVTFAEVRDRRKIFDIEAYSRQHFKSETIPGLEPQQRFPDSRPGTGASFGGRGSHNADRAPRNFGGGGGGRPGFGGGRGAPGGFSDRNAAGARPTGADSYQNGSNFGGDRDRPRGGFNRDAGPRDGGDNGSMNYAPRKGGFNDRFAGSRPDAAPRGGDFAGHKPAFNKPMGVKPGNAGKVFVPRDAKKRAARTFD